MSEQVTMITIRGHKVGIIGLPSIIKDLKQKDLSDDAELKKQLLQKVRIHNYVPDSTADDYAEALLREYKKSQGLPIEKEKLNFNSIRVLGPGCPACEKLENDIKNILLELNISANVEHIRDINEIAEYGMIHTPGLVINDELIFHGKNLSLNQLKQLLKEKIQ